MASSGGTYIAIRASLCCSTGTDRAERRGARGFIVAQRQQKEHCGHATCGEYIFDSGPSIVTEMGAQNPLRQVRYA
eukprot:1498936-Amphidinium_carterae.1